MTKLWIIIITGTILLLIIICLIWYHWGLDYLEHPLEPWWFRLFPRVKYYFFDDDVIINGLLYARTDERFKNFKFSDGKNAICLSEGKSASNTKEGIKELK